MENDIADANFYKDLTSEDDVGLILKGHLHIEHQLIELISLTLPFPNRCNLARLSYSAKVELALACGLKEDMRAPLKQIGSLRNDFAHVLGRNIEKKIILDLYNGLSERLKDGLKESHRSIRRGELPNPSEIDERDLLILMIVSLRQTIKAGCLVLKGVVS